MKLRYIIGFFATVFLVLSNAYNTSPAVGQNLAGSELKLLSSSSQEVVLELTVTGFEVEMIEHEGQTYQRLLIPEMEQTDTPGNPQVPTRGALLGLPTTEGISMQVLEADYELLRGYKLYPSPVIEPLDGIQFVSPQPIFAPNQAVYTTDAFYPDQPVELGQTGKLRDQAVGPVQFYPVQFNPVSGEIRLHRRLVVRVTWGGGLGASSSLHSAASPAFEKVLRKTLLNYDSLERPPVVAFAPSPAASGGDIGVAAAGQTLKIGVTEDGIYQLTPSDLTGAGFDLNGVFLDTIKIKNKGTEIRIFTHDDNSNNLFDGSDYILFYGTAITDIYTTKNVYWLEDGGANGKRMTTRNGSGTGTVPSQFPITIHAEEDSFYWTMPGGSSQEDRWFWGERIGYNVAGLDSFRDLPVNLGTLSSGVSATIRVRMKGYTGGFHNTRIRVNGVVVDNQDWGPGQLIHDQEVSGMPGALNLQNGANTIRVIAQDCSPSCPGHQLFVNWLEIDYWRAYVAQNNELLFGAPSAGTYQFEVTNFSTSDVEVFDITDPANVAAFNNTTVTGDKLQFKDTAQADSRYLALTPARYKSPASIDLDQPSDWQNTNNQADYIIITYEDFYNSTLALANHRANVAALNVVTVKIEDVFDEFNYGIYNPQTIRDFLSHAYHNWQQPTPTYVLLVSGATYDYRNLLGLSRVNYVPTHFTITNELGATPSDNWFVAVDGADVLPEMFIGRLTAQTSAQVDDMVAKIINYDINPPDPSWNTDVLLVADDGNPPDTDPTFQNISQSLIDRLPGNFTANKVYLIPGPDDGATSAIVNYINNGSLLVNYSGHGNLNFWAQEKILEPSDIIGLNNTNRLPIVTVANCLNGYFVDDVDPSMAETFLDRPNKGAVAVWADTSLGFASGHKLLLDGFYDAIFQDNELALGESTTTAKVGAFASGWAEMVETFVLFGDPAMKLGLPTEPYVISTTPAAGANFVAVDQNINIIFSKPMNPTTTNLSGPGTAGLVFTPTWSSGDRIVSYEHPDFTIGEKPSFTVDAQDTMDNALITGPVPTTWSFNVGIGEVYSPLIVRDD